MNKRGSMELGVNSIVILVIAIVMLGLILGIVVPKIKQAGLGLESKEPDPTAASSSEPVTLSRGEISAYAGDETVLKLSLFSNTADNAVKPTLTCPSSIATSTSNEKAIAAGESVQYSMIIKISKTATVGTHLCTLDPDITGVQDMDVPIKILK